MTTYLALDLSKRSTGFALWNDRADRPTLGYWVLGSEITTPGMTFLRLHANLDDLHRATGFDNVMYEMPLNLGPAAGDTNADTLFALTGLAAHVDSYCEAKAIRHYRSANMSTWRRHFLGRVPRGKLKDEHGNKIKRKPVNWKDLAMNRARELGMDPRRHDEAEAFGVLDYQVDLHGITPPWRLENPLIEQFGRKSA